MKQPIRKGVVLDDFSPIQNAHCRLIEFARNYVDNLTIVVDGLESGSVPADLRVAWLKELYPGVRIVCVRRDALKFRQGRSFSEGTAAAVKRALGAGEGHLFSFAPHGARLAAALGVKFVAPPEAAGKPVAAHDIVRRPLKHFAVLPAVVRPRFVKRICVFGPESTGKSTLVRKLAAHFNTAYVPEYAEQYIKTNGHELTSRDLTAICRGQIASEERVAREANRVLFCDSDPVTTIIYSERLIGKCPKFIRQQADRRHYDLYLITHIDVPFVNDEHRYIPEERQALLDRCIFEVTSRRRSMQIVRGSWEARFQTAVQAVEELL